MISAILVGLGPITAAIGSLANEIYLAKKVSTTSASLNRRNY
jgi:hypothetical protein